MRFAYADPPYVGCARKHYGEPEVDHEALIARLTGQFQDGWALSATSVSLRYLLPLCPEGVRVAAWVKPFCSFKPGVNPAYAWEPVIFAGGRKRDRDVDTVRDWVSANITLRRGLSGVKLEEFSFWIFGLLGMSPDDDFVDLYPGSGAVTDAWVRWCWLMEHETLWGRKQATPKGD